MKFIKLNALTLYLLLCASCLSFGQEQSDSISKVKKKRYFIEVEMGGGVGWRNYNDIRDSIIVWYPSHVQDEKPGLAYSFKVNKGFIRKNFSYTLGIEYDCVKFFIDASDSMGLEAITQHGIFYFRELINYKYTFTHLLLSIPFTVNYLFGKDKNWYAGGNIKLGWLFNYFQTRELSDEQFSIVNTYHNLTMGGDIKQKSNSYFARTPVVWIGVQFGKKIVEGKKWNINVGFQASYSSTVGQKKITREYYYPPNQIGGAPSQHELYESRPHRLVVPVLNLSLQYKITNE